jgi:prophage regulatory protein
MNTCPVKSARRRASPSEQALGGTAPQLIDIRELATRLSISRTSIYRLIAEDASFPRPVRIGVRRITFVEEEVDAYIVARMAERTSQLEGPAGHAR